MSENIFRFRKAQDDIFDGGRYLGEIIPKGDNPVNDVPGFWKTPAVLVPAYGATRVRFGSTKAR